MCFQELLSAALRFILGLALLFNIIGPIPSCLGDVFVLPKPGVMVHLSPPFDPPIFRGIRVHPDNPFRFEFILDKGDKYNPLELKEESTRLIKYFLASLTIPEKDLWVNLSPYEKDRIIPQSFGLTEMGRDLLAEDYILKQITASLMYPEGEVGKKFWKRVYEEASKRFGTTDVPVSTFNKVWIVPEKAVIYENAKAATAYIVESKLKVMLEQDYLALSKKVSPVIASPKGEAISKRTTDNDVNALGSQIVREIVIPELTKEVNQDKNFAQLRQVYNSLILATWYKNKIRESILAQVYEDRNKTVGVQYTSSVIPGNTGAHFKNDIEGLYQQYLKAFKKGVYNYIKEEIDPISQQMIPKKYFSGGFSLSGVSAEMTSVSSIDFAQMAGKDVAIVVADLTILKGADKAMSAETGAAGIDPLVMKMGVLLSELRKQVAKKSIDEVRNILVEEIQRIESKGNKLFNTDQAEELMEKSGALQRVAFLKVLVDIKNREGDVLFESPDLIKISSSYPIFRQTEILELIDGAKDEEDRAGSLLFNGADIIRVALNVVPATDKQVLISFLKENTSFTGHSISEIISLGEMKKRNVDLIKDLINKANEERLVITADEVIDLITSEAPEIEMEWLLHHKKTIPAVQDKMVQLNKGLSGIRIAEIPEAQQLGDVIRKIIGETLGDVNQLKEGRKKVSEFVRMMENHEILFATTQPLPPVETQFGTIDLNRLNNIAAYNRRTMASDMLRDLWIAGLVGLIRVNLDQLALDFGIKDAESGHAAGDMIRSRRILLGMTIEDFTNKIFEMYGIEGIDVQKKRSSLRVDIGRWENGLALPDKEAAEDLSLQLGFRNQSLWIQIVKQRMKSENREETNFKNLLWQARIFKGLIDKTLGERIGVSQGSMSLYQDVDKKALPDETMFRDLVKELDINDKHPLGITLKKFRVAYEEALGISQPEIGEPETGRPAIKGSLRQMSHDELLGKVIIQSEKESSQDREAWMMKIVTILQQRRPDNTLIWVARLQHPVAGIRIEHLVPLEQVFSRYELVTYDQAPMSPETRRTRQPRSEGRYIKLGEMLKVYVRQSGIKANERNRYVRGEDSVTEPQLSRFLNGHDMPGISTLRKVCDIFRLSSEARGRLLDQWKLENGYYVDEETLGSYLAKGRAAKGYSRKQLGEATGFHENVIRSFEQDEEVPHHQRILERFPQIVDFLGLDHLRVQILYQKAKIAKMMRMQLGRDFTNDTLGAYLLNGRLNMMMERSELASAIGVSAVTIFRWENDDSSPGKRLNAVISFLKLDINKAKEYKPVKPFKYDTIGEYVRYGRIKMGLSQLELANAIGVGMRAIVSLEGENEIIQNRVKFLALMRELRLDIPRASELSGIKKIDPDVETIGAYLLNERQNRGLTRNEVAEKVDIAIGALKYLELDKRIPRQDNIVMSLVDFYGLSRERAKELLDKARKAKRADQAQLTEVPMDLGISQKSDAAMKAEGQTFGEMLRGFVSASGLKRNAKGVYEKGEDRISRVRLSNFYNGHALPKISTLKKIYSIFNFPPETRDMLINQWKLENRYYIDEETLGSYLRKAREAKGKTRNQIYESFDFRPPFLNVLENNKEIPDKKETLDKLDKYIEFLGLNPIRVQLLFRKAIIAKMMKAQLGLGFSNDTLGTYLLNGRIGMMLDEEEIASAIGVSARTIARWENDEHIPGVKLTTVVAFLGLDINRAMQYERIRIKHETIGAYIKYGRVRMGMTQEELASVIGLGVATIQRLESKSDVLQDQVKFLALIRYLRLDAELAYELSGKEKVDPETETLGLYLTNGRIDRGLSRDELAEKVGMLPYIIKNMELNLKSPPDEERLMRVIDFLKLSRERAGELLIKAREAKEARDSAQLVRTSESQKGGIDLSSYKALTVQNNGQSITFHINPTMLEQLQNAPGFVPVIIDIQPMINLREFLGFA